MDRLEQIKDIIAEELGHWARLHSAETDPEEKIKLHGAVCELLMYAGFPDKITADYLRDQYKIRLERSKTPALSNRDLDLTARNRAVKACAAIIKLGRRIAALDKKTK